MKRVRAIVEALHEPKSVRTRFLVGTGALSRQRHPLATSQKRTWTKPLARRTLRVRRPGRWLPLGWDKFGSQGGPCDPSQKNDAGRTPASQLRSNYHRSEEHTSELQSLRHLVC